MTTGARPNAATQVDTVVAPARSAPLAFGAPWADPPAIDARPASAIDIPRLTDQVVRVINERVVAQHERMGRAF